MIVSAVSAPLIVEVVLLLPVVVAVGWVAARTLGIRQSWTRIFLTGLIGLALGVSLANWSVVHQPNHEGTLALRIAAFSVLVTMAASIALDFFAKPGGPDRSARVGRLPKLPHPIRRVQRTIAPPRRFREVLDVARREGLLQPRFASAAGISDPEFGARLRATLEGCGGMFVKLGQVAATRTDLLPAPLIAELSQLQSSVAPAEPAAMREVVEAELGCPAEEVFASFDWKPLAAASIAHVYRATLSGEPVAVKVQRPQVAEIVARDTQAMLTLASFIQRRTAIGLRVDVLAFVHEFTDAINEELDFAHEARATERIRTNRLDDKGIHIPRVHMDLCTRRLIVMEEVHGRPVSDPAALAASPVPPQELADRLLASYLGQIFRDGAFHADPHPGNVLLDKEGTLHLLDFGSTGILDAATLDALGTILVAIAMNAPELFQRAILDLAPPPSGADLTGLSSDLTRFLAVHQHGGGFDAGMLKAMIDVLQRHRLAIPTSLTLLSRAVLTLDGTLHIVAPGYPLADRATEIAKPLLVPFEPTEQGIQRELLRTLPRPPESPQPCRGDRDPSPLRTADRTNTVFRGSGRRCVLPLLGQSRPAGRGRAGWDTHRSHHPPGIQYLKQPGRREGPRGDRLRRTLPWVGHHHASGRAHSARPLSLIRRRL